MVARASRAAVAGMPASAPRSRKRSRSTKRRGRPIGRRSARWCCRCIADPPLQEAVREAADCRRCHLYRDRPRRRCSAKAPAHARVVFVGEQPGDQEDVIGRPFVGPAGQIMDRAMEEAGIDRRTVYITNAVKHFKFTPRGKRRIHQTPESAGNPGLPLLAGRGAGAAAAEADGGDGRHRGARGARPRGHHHPRARPADQRCRTARRRSSPCIRRSCCACRTRTRRRGSTAPSSPTCARWRSWRSKAKGLCPLEPR